jgi:hypothetical protein
MTIIEAIKSGKRFRRPRFPAYRWMSYDGKSKIMGFDFETGCRDFYYPDKEDILADDWETETPTFDRTMLRNAWATIYGYSDPEKVEISPNFQALAVILGL